MLLTRSLVTGFIGGLFWCSITLILNYFKIVDLSPKTYLSLIINNKWLFKWYGTFFTIVIYGVISIFIAYIYYIAFKKIGGLMFSVLYGMGLFILVLFIFPQFSSDFPYLLTMTRRSILTSACILILYGTFIGYSISFDFKQMKVELNKK